MSYLGMALCHTLAWCFDDMRCFRSCWLWNPVGQSQMKWALIPWHLLDITFQSVYLCISLELGELVAGNSNVLITGLE